MDRHRIQQYIAGLGLLICALSILRMLVVLAISVATPAFRPMMAGEFRQFRAAGIIARDAPQRLFDLEFQRRVERSQDVELGSRPAFLPFAAGPWIAVPCVTFALLPYTAAWVLWAIVSCCLYAGTVMLLLPRRMLRPALLIAGSFPVFLSNTLMLGQISTIACFGMGLAIYLDRAGSLFLSGLSLAVCAYKPTLLLWVAPMLLLTGRFRAIAGLATGVACLSALSTAVLGVEATAGWFRILLMWARSAILPAAGDEAFMTTNTPLYVDLNAFRKLAGIPTLPVAVFVGACLVAVVLAWRYGSSELVWPVTLTATLVISPYMPMYDCLLLVPVVLVMFDKHSSRVFLSIAVLLYVCAAFSFEIAKSTRIQPYTIAIIVLLGYELWIALRPAGHRVSIRTSQASVRA